MKLLHPTNIVTLFIKQYLRRASQTQNFTYKSKLSSQLIFGNDLLSIAKNKK